MSSRMTGDWDLAGVHLNFIGKRLTTLAKNSMKQAGEDFVEIVRGHIDRQDLPWVPLSPKTVEKKGNGIIYIETKTLYKELKVRGVRSTKNGASYFAGANPWTTHEPSGLRLSTLLTYLEYGTDTIPPRPIIEPSVEEFKSSMPKKFKKYMNAELRGGG